MSYNQEYNEQPVYELDFQYSEDSESDNTILQNIYRMSERCPVSVNIV